MKRRSVCGWLAAVPWGLAAPSRAQGSRPARVAVLFHERGPAEPPILVELRAGLRERGYVEGRNLVLELFRGDGVGARTMELAAAATRDRFDVIVTSGPSLSWVIESGTRVPVVFTYSGDPVAGGIVESYARPGVNRTGVTLFSIEMMPKRIALLGELAPRARRLAFIADPRHAGQSQEFDATRAAADRSGLAVEPFLASTAAEFDAAFGRMAAWRADCAVIISDGATLANAEGIAAGLVRQRAAGIGGWAVMAERGALATYGPVREAVWRRLAWYVDRIVHGAKAAELPIERPATFETVINLATARALGIVVSPVVLARADRTLG